MAAEDRGAAESTQKVVRGDGMVPGWRGVEEVP